MLNRRAAFVFIARKSEFSGQPPTIAAVFPCEPQPAGDVAQDHVLDRYEITYSAADWV